MTSTQDPAALPDRAAPPEPGQSQQRYEVRFDWGIDGLRSIAPGAGVIVLVEVLPAPATPAEAPSAVESPILLSSRVDASAELRAAASGYGVPVLAGALRNRSAVARWVLAHQQRLGGRAMVAVVAAGKRRPDGATRFAIEDQLAAGAVVEALQLLGIDFCSPEAAVAAASFSGLTRAVGHLLTASVTGQELAAAAGSDGVAEVKAAARLDASEIVPILRDGAFDASLV